ncbi:MAG: hypothetical protein KC431_04590 [Myxococcales bacterium]|nr:hypothetical protein [Myxococcales bacterium]
MRRLLPLSLITLLAAACHPQTGSTDTADNSQAGEAKAAPEPAARPKPPPPPQAALARGQAPRGGLTEVVLDPRGEAALSLDRFGSVLLWPALRSRDAQQATPFTLPLHEPIWMTVAKAGEGRFVVASIDAGNTGAVGLVELSPGNDQAPRYTELFNLGPADPLFELHVLDGGERILALGIDHRLRLYDRQGRALSTIDEVGFSPWQLRLAGGVGEAPKLAVVLAQPLRIQTLEIAGDALRLVGQPQPFELDRGPNRNDLVLSPDGRTVAALRRPKARTRQWSVELIDLGGGERKLIAGRTDSLFRPRMHFIDAGRLLLESGSGKGFWVDLSQAVVPADPADLHPDSKAAERLSKALSHPSIRLPGSVESGETDFRDRPIDEGARMHASVAGGLRASLDHQKPGVLILDPLEQPGEAGHHDELGFPTLEIHAGAIDDDSGAVVWANQNKLFVTGAEGESVIEVDREGHRGLFFVDDQHLLLVAGGGKGRAILYRRDGTRVGERKLELAWGIEALDYRAEGAGKGRLVWSDSKPGVPLRSIVVDTGAGDALAPLTTIDGAELAQWTSVRKLSDEAVFELIGQRPVGELDEWARDVRGRWFLTVPDIRTPLTVIDGDQTRQIAMPAGQGRELVPSPDGSLLAVVQFREHREGFFRAARQDLLVSVYDGESFERLWTRGLFARGNWSDREVDLRWSSGGASLVVLNSGDGRIYDARSGELRASREMGGLTIAEVAD